MGREDPLEEGMATHPSILAWRLLRTEEPGGLQSMGSQSQTQLKRLSTHARPTSGSNGREIDYVGADYQIGEWFEHLALFFAAA